MTALSTRQLAALFNAMPITHDQPERERDPSAARSRAAPAGALALSPEPAADAVTSPSRLAALKASGLLDSPAEEAFDRLTRLVQRLLGAPVALMSLVDDDRQFFKSAAGLAEPWASRRETPLSHSFCRLVVARGIPLTVFNAPEDERVRDNKAIKELGVVAYLGVPLTDSDGQVLGSFCAIDSQPRAWSEEDLQTLLDLAASVMTEIELRASVQALQESEARFERAVMGSSDGLWEWDFTHDTLYLSPRSKAILGYADHEIENNATAWRTLLHPEDHGRVMGMLIRYVSGADDEYRAEFRMRHKDGSYRWLLSRGHVFRDEQNRPVRMAGSHTDVTERKRVEQEAEQVDRLIQRITDTAPVLIYVYDLVNQRFLYVNREAGPMLGYTPAALDAMNSEILTRIIHPADQALYTEHLTRVAALADNQYAELTCRTLRAGGEWRWLHSRDTVFARDPQTGAPTQILGVAEDLTLSRESEAEARFASEALRESEERFRRLSEAAMEGIAFFAEEHLLDVNSACVRLFGYDAPTSMIGLSVAEMVTPECYNEVTSRNRSGYEGAYECVCVRQNGSHFIAEIQGRILPFGGVMVRVIAIRDITDRKRAEEKLRLSEEHLRVSWERYRSLVNVMSDWIWEVDTQGRYTMVSTKVTDSLGYSPEELVGCAPFMLMAPEEARRMGDKSATIIASQRPFSGMENEMIAKDGQRLLFEISGTPIFDADGNWTGYRGVNRDITAHRMAERSLRHVLERVHCILWHATVEELEIAPGKFELRWDTQISNEVAAQEVLPLEATPEKPYMDAWLESRLPDDRLRMDLRSIEALRGGEERYAQDFRCRDRFGAIRWLREDAHIEAMGPGRWRVVGVCTNVTDRRQAEEDLRALATELQRSNQALDEFASVASHDLQEPLRKIQAFGGRLKAKWGDTLGSDGQDYLERMLSASSRMQVLIQDLLTYSRVTTKAQPFRRVALTEIVRGVLGDLEVHLMRQDVHVDIKTLPTLEADATQMRQLFQNLLGNALKFTRQGTTPEVRIFSQPSPSGSRFRRIVVSDNGIGFEPQYAERIFEVFERLHTRSDFEGTGMGLAICRRIVERHGGRIIAEGVPGQGATFTVDLPVRQGTSEHDKET